MLGANGGIGMSLCKRILADPQTNLVVACRNPESMKALVEALSPIPSTADRIMSVQVDATKPDQVEACVKAVLDKHKRIDGAANCVGSIVLKPGHLTTEAEFQETIMTNLNSSFTLLRCLARPMMKEKNGSIVFCSSAVASIGIPNHEAIAAAKAGVVGLAKSAASTYARYNIRVNTVAPGLTDTGIAKRITSNEAALKASTAMHPLGRIAQPDDVAAAIHFLLTHEYITGQNLAVDGGLGSLK